MLNQLSQPAVDLSQNQNCSPMFSTKSQLTLENKIRSIVKTYPSILRSTCLSQSCESIHQQHDPIPRYLGKNMFRLLSCLHPHILNVPCGFRACESSYSGLTYTDRARSIFAIVFQHPTFSSWWICCSSLLN